MTKVTLARGWHVNMKWFGISGSWRATSPEIERAVRKTARNIVLAGDGIVTGGALNVDYQVTKVRERKMP